MTRLQGKIRRERRNRSELGKWGEGGVGTGEPRQRGPVLANPLLFLRARASAVIPWRVCVESKERVDDRVEITPLATLGSIQIQPVKLRRGGKDGVKKGKKTHKQTNKQTKEVPEHVSRRKPSVSCGCEWRRS